ncbi:EAL domain-containing protein [Tsukamurella sp. 8F]|uniref:putative bifunctional diguanylate cyclase/phosphodiesterase n=1 Tax=unclassified Tsukamurella TaxID=2633480 RepID=UPI0023B8DF86|nr:MULTISPECIES: EAL domain-containing protein [unclassified Tsukamurella]MDF0530216.1 EAL domain-containing protein [Tsukamurella sp. 8J]MDF0586533.1 EAL domain-containing protein [Tsukamurella sp. 8F]
MPIVGDEGSDPEASNSGDGVPWRLATTSVPRIVRRFLAPARAWGVDVSSAEGSERPHPGTVQAFREMVAGLLESAAGRDDVREAGRSAADDDPMAEYGRLLRAVFAQSGVGVGISDVSGRMLAANTAFAAMLGYDLDEFMTLSPTDITYPDDPDAVWPQYEDLVGGRVEWVRLEKPHVHKSGSTVWININMSLIRDGAGAPAYTVALFEDISDRHRMQERLRYQASHDDLTGLANRAQFYDRLTAAFQDPSAEVGVCQIDLDRFKTINDSLGHTVGDRLLAQVAERLRTCLTGPDQIISRIGGDEFVLLVPRTTGSDQMAALADTMLKVLDSPIDVDGHRLSVSASIGVISTRACCSSPEELMKDADTTLHWAKEDGRARWAAYDADRSSREATRYDLSARMREALDRGEFVVLYQPIVDLAGDSGRIVGAEALVRWQHPTLGLLAPDRFIDLAEDNGLILPLGTRVLDQACRDAVEWRAASGEDLFVSINVSPLQLRDPDFLRSVERTLSATGIMPHRVQFEITESAFIGTSDSSVTALTALSAAGARIAIDDFGTGFSNMAYLRRLPVDVLKLAGPFIEDLGDPMREQPADEHIVRGLINIAHGLGQTVTAEQVANRAQAARLRGLRCDHAQGWFFARAMPSADFTAAVTG